ncbi:hypothetical protein NQ314_017035 [Rhamnusium bicolor]|uniref:Histone deacetylase complex subunit SAP130 C-terminal domain-containing protein n=1 Tax=Rhamnusium bicolor TaxID=1586634 RepID=A0AAV8WVC8_9CUCU|nr:hypothetical protein NQ314_017035 [Rhamnusium bicolor]
MSGNAEEEKESQKAVPLDLARNQIAAVRSIENKTPLVMTSQSLRGMRVLTQGVSSANPTGIGGQTIITTNLMSQAVLKSDSNRAQIANIITSSTSQPSISGNLSRPAQITLSTTPLLAQSTVGTTYHVPRGPAVVANLAAPRSNVATVRTPMVVTAQSGQPHSFVRPPRTPSPAQGTAWLTNSSNGSQIKGAPTVLSSPVRGATVTGKPQIIGRTQPQSVTSIRPGAILQNAITIGQSGQIHSFKPGATGIQALGNTVTIAQVLPSRTQAVVYNANTSAQFTPTARITVANTAQNQRQPQTRPIGQVTSSARLTVPVSQSSARLVAPQATVLTSGARISTISTQQQPTGLGTTAARIVSSQPNVTIGRLSVAASPAAVSTTNLLGQTRISTLNLHSLSHNSVAVVPPQAISIAKVFPQSESQGPAGAATNVFIHTPVQSAPRRTSPSPNPTTSVTQTSSTTTTTVATYSLASGAYFYDTTAGNYSVSRSYNQQQSPFAAISQATQQQTRPSINTQVHGIVNQQMRFNPVMVVEQNRAQQFQSSHSSEPAHEQPQQSQTPKITSSPRPSILRKRDHEGSPLKAAKNITPVLSNLPLQSQAPISPPSRPDSRGNGHSSATGPTSDTISGGSTTISATSSPGLAEVNDDSNPHASMNNKEEEEAKPPIEMSPRKKPRKQQLTGNDLDEHNDDMQFIESTVKKENEDSDMNHSDEPRDGAPEAGQITTVRKPASASLLNSYRQNWKATHNHYLRHSDVRPKDERRPTIMDLANQYRVQDKVNGWKIHHLSTQMEDLADQEQTVYNQLTELLKCTESEESCKQFDKEVNRINELIKGNLQRIKIINDGMIEAKTQIMKIFDHKVHVTDIINRCASKRNFKKREKS